MPQLPTYQSQRQLSTEKRGAVQQGAADTANIISQGIGQVKDISQKWVDAIATVQYTAAAANSSAAYLDLTNRASIEQDFSKRDEYLEEANKIASEAMDSVKDQRAKNKLYADLTYSSKATEIKINAHFNAREIEFGQTKLEEGIETKLQERLTATTSFEVMKIDSDIITLIESNKEAGVIDKKQADKYKEEYRKTGVQYEIYADDSITEEESPILERLRKGKGIYRDLSTDVRLKLIKESQARISQNNQAYKRDIVESRSKRLQDLLIDVEAGTATMERFDKEWETPEEEGGIKKDRITKVKKGYVKTKLKPAVQRTIDDSNLANKYLKMIDDIVDNPNDYAKAQEILVNTFADGTVDPKEAVFWDAMLKQNRDIKDVESKNPIMRVIRAVRRWGDDYINEPDKTVAALNIQELIRRVSAGENPDVVGRDVIKEQIKNNDPELIMVDEIPNAVMSGTEDARATGDNVLNKKADKNIGEADKDEFGYIFGMTTVINGIDYKYVGNDEWTKIQ